MASSLTVPKKVQENFKLGLLFYEAGLGGKGLVDDTISEARKMAKGIPPSMDKLILMKNWFAGHGAKESEMDAKNRQERDIKNGIYRKSPAYVAWFLWGGDEGREWVRKLKI